MTRTWSCVMTIVMWGVFNYFFDNNVESWKTLFNQAWAVAFCNINYYYFFQER